MAEEREGELVYLLITFNVPNHEMLSTEELAGHPGGELHKVEVNWLRLLTTIKEGGSAPVDPPWTRAVVDEDYRPPLWNRAAEDNDDKTSEGEEKPPEV